MRLITDGVKTVEVRVGYPKMRRIQAGHELTFVSGDDTVATRVKRVTEYDIGESRDDLLAVIREIYPPEKEKLAMTD